MYVLAKKTNKEINEKNKRKDKGKNTQSECLYIDTLMRILKLFVAVYYYLSVDFKQKDDINGKIGRKMMWQSCCCKDNRHIWIKQDPSRAGADIEGSNLV